MGPRIHRVCDELKYARHVVFHPFDGFWDLKHEKRGSLLTAGIFLFLLVLTFVLKSQLTGFILNKTDVKEFNVIYCITGILLPFLVWCLSNWCITTLMDGEGSFCDILITTAYAAVPLIPINLLTIILSNVFTLEEAAFYYLLNTVGYGWFALLLFCGILTIHDFSIGKNLMAFLVTLIGMIIMLFLVILFLFLVQYMYNFIRLFLREFQMRLNY